MKICENGHSYDETQFGSCPICYAMSQNAGAAGGADTQGSVYGEAAGQAADASSYGSEETVRDENGGYYDADGNYFDAAGNKFIPAEGGGFFDEQGGYYDVNGNYYPPAAPVQSAAPVQQATAAVSAAQPSYGEAQQPAGSYTSPAGSYTASPEPYTASAGQQMYQQPVAQGYGPEQAGQIYNNAAPMGKPQKEKGGKKKVIIIAVIAAVLLAAAAVWFFFLRDTDKIGKDDEGRKTMTRNGDTFLLNSYSSDVNSIIPPGFLMYSSDTKKISFLYNDYYTISDEKNVVYVNLSADGSEYIEVRYKSGKTSPKEYFKKYKKALIKEYGNDSVISDILEVDLINNPETGVYKNGYCVSAEVDDNGRNQYVDRYLMIYEKNYLEVTAYSYTAKAADEPAYRICSSFYTRANGFDPYEATEVIIDPPPEMPTDVPTTETPTTEMPTTAAPTETQTTEYTTQATTESSTQNTEATTSGGGGDVEVHQGTGVKVVFPAGMCPNGSEATQTGLNLYVLPDTKDSFIAIEYASYGPADIQQCVNDIFSMFCQNLGAQAQMRDQETIQGANYTFTYAPGILSNDQGSIKLVAAAVKSDSGKIYAIYFLTDDAHENYFLEAFQILVDNIYLD